MRISVDKLHPSLKKQFEKELAQVIVDIRDLNEATLFLNDFFHPTEKETFAKRLAIAYWLRKGKGYVLTKYNIKVSSATIALIKKMAEKPGFQLALKKMEAEEWANQWADRIKGIVNKK